MAEFVTVGRAEDVPVGEARAFDASGRVVAIARTEEGWYAFDDVCTHQGCSLADGEIEGHIVICPCHGSEFDLATGEVMNGPADEPIRTYEVRTEDDQLQVSP
jgi:3-phenylpropionate/trans-cinnamate dioxygenase ferredoxin subunit